jgi:ribonuclease P protein component
MLPKTERLTTKELDILFKEGKQRNFPLFLVTYIPAPRFALSALTSKKVFPTAVERNSIRRKVYNSIKYVEIRPKASIALVCNKKITQATPIELHAAIHELFLFLS